MHPSLSNEETMYEISRLSESPQLSEKLIEVRIYSSGKLELLLYSMSICVTWNYKWHP